MTSKISFFSLVREERRRLNWLLALQILIFWLLIPFRILIQLSTARNMDFPTGDALSVFCKNVGFGHIENTIVILGAGVLCALVSFSYLHSVVQLNFYHSLAVRRERLLAVKLVSSLETFLIAYLSGQVLAILAGAVNGAFSCRAAVEIMVSSLLGILYFISSYLSALLAVFLTGKLLTTVLAGVVFGLYIPMILMLFWGYQDSYFQTMAGESLVPGMNWALLHSSPWVYCMDKTSALALWRDRPGVKGVTGFWPSASDVIPTVVMIMLLLLLVVLLYRLRRTEAAGEALAFRQTEGIIKLMLSIPAALWAAVIGDEILRSLTWDMVLLVLFGTLGCVIMEFIYRWDIRQILSHWGHILITVAAAGAIFLFFRLDLIGYNSYLPQQEEIASMAACSYYMEFRFPDENNQISPYSYDSISADILEKFETQEFEGYYRLAEAGVANAVAGTEGDTVLVGVKFHLKNGKEVYRKYCVEEELFLEVFDEEQKNREFVEAYYPIMTWDEAFIDSFDGGTCYLSKETGDGADDAEPETSADSAFSGAEEYMEEGIEYAADYNTDSEYCWELSNDDIKRVVEAYRKDLLEVSFSDCWNLGRIYAGSLNFQMPVSGYEEYRSYDYDSYALGENFTNTMAVLEEILAWHE